MDIARFFGTDEALTFTVQSSDPKIATVSIEGSKVTVTGVAVGSTSYMVKASNGKTQTAVITVRRKANDNGWL